MSGLCAGCYLQMNGFETEIFEKHFIPGGLCTSWHKDGYTIDGCIHWILGSDSGSSFHKMWSEILNMKKVEFVNHDVRIEMDVKENKNKYGNKTFTLYTNIDKLQEYLLDLAPEDYKPINELIRSMRVMQKYDLPPVMDDLPFFQSVWRGIKMTRYLEFGWWFLKLKNETNYTFAKKLKNNFLRESFELLYDGNEVNILVITMPLASFDKKSAGYPVGGSLEFAKKIEQAYLALGGKIHYKTPVKRILVENNKAVGLLVRNEVKHYSDFTLSAADWHYTVFDALEGKFVNEHMLQLRDLKKFEVFYSIVHLGFGIADELKDHPHFSRFPLEEDLILPDGTKYDRLEIHIYNYDRTMAPPGKSAVVVSFYTKKGDWWIDLRKNNRPEYRKVKKEFTEKIVGLIKKRLKNIDDKIEMTDMATPATVHRYTNNWKGSTQGWLPGENFLAASPVDFTLPGLENFYYSSHWNQPGGGLPIAIKTGRDVAKFICKKNKKRFITNKIEQKA